MSGARGGWDAVAHGGSARTPDLPAVSTTLCHLASWNLPGRGPRSPLAAPDGEHFDGDTDNANVIALADETRRHRVTGIALRAIDAGALEGTTDSLRGALVERHHTLLHQSLLAEADLVAVARLLHGRGVEFRVLKGLATAHLDHHDPAERTTSDVDILVRPTELAIASEVLASVVDRSASLPDRRPRHAERYGKDRTLRLQGGGWLDLHRLLVPAYWGFSIDHDRFFDEPGEHFAIAGTDLRALSRPYRLLHAVLHAGATDEIRLQSLRDVAVLLGDDRTDASLLLDDRHRPVHGLLALGLLRVAALFDVEHPTVEWARRVRPGPRERLALRARRLDGARDHWTGPLALPPYRWPGYLAPIVVPDSGYRSWYRRSRFDHLRAATGAFRRNR